MTATEDGADKIREKAISAFVHVGDKGGPLGPVFWNHGKICPCLAIRTHKSRRLTSLMSILKDLGHVRAALATLIKHIDTRDEEELIINQCLWFSSVVTYGKCFTSGSGRTVTLNERKDLRGVTADENARHKEMIETRNAYVAHAGESKEEQAVTLLVLHPDRSNKSILAVFPFSVSAISIPPTTLGGNLRLVEKVIRNVEESKRKASKSVWQEANESPIAHLYERAIVPKPEKLLGVRQRIDVPPTET